MTDYTGNDGKPLVLRYRVRHTDNKTTDDLVLQKGDLTDILNRKEIVIRMPNTSGTRGYYRPILFGLARRNGDINYNKFNAALVTFRFRKREADDGSERRAD